MLESARLANGIATAFATVGWIVTDCVVSSPDVDRLVDAITPYQDTVCARGGVRNLFELPEVTSLAQSPDVRAVAEAVLGADCVAVKATLFDKTPQANWKVSWHQDVTISVRERLPVAGFEAWSYKDGTPHVQPPASVLEGMLAVRIHLDDCGLDNGPVRVIPGSHLAGRFSGAEIESGEPSRRS
jgi:ectoine hydroxylase-related dioxygenase (phytanoyl-CoA dioxygenase family)